MKKVICILFALLLCLQLAPVAMAEEATQIIVSDAVQCQGGKMTLEVSIVNNPGYANISLQVLYDAAALKLTDVEKVNAPSMFIANPETALISAAGMNNIHGDGVMFVLHFDVLAPGSYTVSLRLDSFGDAMAEPLTAQIREGSVKVGQHTYSVQERQPTCTEDGATVHTCEICGDVYESDSVPALGHQFDDKKDTTCNSCGLRVGEGEPGTTKPNTTGQQNGGGNIWLVVLASVLFGALLTVLLSMIGKLHRRRRTEDNVPLPTLDEEDGYFEDEE